jgi:DNA-binding Xre family transcriptional regulator
MVRLRVKEVAEAKGYNQSSLARDAQIGFTTVKRLFRDPYTEVTIGTLSKIADALHVSIHDLIEEVDGEPTEPH